MSAAKKPPQSAAVGSTRAQRDRSTRPSGPLAAPPRGAWPSPSSPPTAAGAVSPPRALSTSCADSLVCEYIVTAMPPSAPGASARPPDKLPPDAAASTRRASASERAYAQRTPQSPRAEACAAASAGPPSPPGAVAHSSRMGTSHDETPGVSAARARSGRCSAARSNPNSAAAASACAGPSLARGARSACALLAWRSAAATTASHSIGLSEHVE